MGIDQALTSAPFTYANRARGGGDPAPHINPAGTRGTTLTPALDLQPENMVKFFSVDWLAQSHFGEAEAQLESETDQSFKPHVPCMVQPSAPSYGKGYLQLKPKTAKNSEDTAESGGLGSPRSSCASPGKFTRTTSSSARVITAQSVF